MSFGLRFFYFNLTIDLALAICIVEVLTIRKKDMT